MYIFQKYWADLVLENKKFVSAHVVIFDDDKFLIVKRSKSDPWMAGRYGLPGGKIEKGESVRQALTRECMEEVNLKIYPENCVFLPKISNKNNHAFYFCTKFEGKIKLDTEHDDYKWVKFEDLNNYSTVPDLSNTISSALETKK